MKVARFNQSQRKLLVCASALLLLMLLFPPFVVYLQGGVLLNPGYAFILSGPGNPYAVVNVSLLALQIVVLAVLALIGWLLLADSSDEPNDRAAADGGESGPQ